MRDSTIFPTIEFNTDQAATTSGLYVSTGLQSALLLDIEQSRFRLFHLDGKRIIDRSSYFQALAHLFEFGSHFGHNWDALADCLTDCSWGENDRIVVVYSDYEPFAISDPEAWAIAMEIWEASVVFWQAQGVKLSIVFQVSGDSALSGFSL